MRVDLQEAGTYQLLNVRNVDVVVDGEVKGVLGRSEDAVYF